MPTDLTRHDPAVEAFCGEWPVYAKAVDHDYFSHRAAAEVLHRFLAAEFDRPFRFLDLACGAARLAVAALHGTRVCHYRGIDLSEPARAAAREAVQSLPCPAELVRADLVDAVRGETADVIWVGLSVHHLRTLDKVVM